MFFHSIEDCLMIFLCLSLVLIIKWGYIFTQAKKNSKKCLPVRPRQQALEYISCWWKASIALWVVTLSDTAYSTVVASHWNVSHWNVFCQTALFWNCSAGTQFLLWISYRVICYWFSTLHLVCLEIFQFLYNFWRKLKQWNRRKPMYQTNVIT